MGGSVKGDRAEADSPGVKGAASCWPWVFPRNVSKDGHGRRATLSITRADRNAMAPRCWGLSADYLQTKQTDGLMNQVSSWNSMDQNNLFLIMVNRRWGVVLYQVGLMMAKCPLPPLLCNCWSWWSRSRFSKQTSLGKSFPHAAN